MNDGIRNILEIFNKATPQERAHGRTWYLQAHGVGMDMMAASGHGGRAPMTHSQCCAVLAALSPSNRWERNVRDGLSFARWYANGASMDKLPTVCTYNANRDKAAEICLENPRIHQDFADFLPGRKTRSFARLCNRPGLPATVVIDRHAIRIYRGDEPGTGGSARVSDREYDDAEYAYIKAAEHLRDNVNDPMTAGELQATTWVTWRRLGGG